MTDTAFEQENKPAEAGKIVFADDVIATIAALAISEVEGVAGMSGGMVDGITEKFGRKNVTKGVKVEVGSEEAAVDISINVKYGYAIQNVCKKLQDAVKNGIESMTGLKVVEVNVFVQSVVFEKPAPAPVQAEAVEPAPEAEEIPAPETRVK